MILQFVSPQKAGGTEESLKEGGTGPGLDGWAGPSPFNRVCSFFSDGKSWPGAVAPGAGLPASVSSCLRGFLVPLLAVAVLGTAGCRSWFLPDLSPRSDIDTLRIERALEANPENYHAEYMLGRAALEDGNLRRAQQHFSRATEIAPHFEEAHHGLGLALLERNRHRAAFEHYTEMTERFADSPLGHEGMAAAALLLGDYDIAEAAAREALRLDSGSAQANLVLGELLYAHGDFPGAYLHLTRAIRTDRTLESQLRPLLEDLEGYMQKYGDR